MHILALVYPSISKAAGEEAAERKLGRSIKAAKAKLEQTSKAKFDADNFFYDIN
jgi:hypothetical protein